MSRLAVCVAGALLVLAASGVAEALERPTAAQVEQYRKDGSLAERRQWARALGNHRVRPDVAASAAYRLERLAWERGLSKAEPTSPPPAWRGMPTKGNVRVFALLIAFSDAAPTISQASIDAKLFGDGEGGYPAESLRNFYRRSSYGLLELLGATLGWYTTPYPRSQVAQTDAGREALIEEALASFDAAGHDFSQYDNDGDGAIDYFMVMWTGADEGWGSFWWAYQTRFGDRSYELDGKRLRDYSWQWPPSGAPRAAIHETGHALGLPDYYDYDVSLGPRGGAGDIDMMDADWGDHNCFSKFLLDWVSPTLVSGGSRSVSLRPSGSAAEAVLFTRGATGDAFAEYFMLQNRTRTGNDSDLPGDGLLVWHVDARPNASGTDYLYDNSYTAHKLLRLMEASGREQIEAGWSAGPEDYYVAPKTITHWTSPSTARYDGTPSFMQVVDISVAGDPMTARVQELFDATPPSGAPTTPTDGGTTATGLRFRWTPGNVADPETGIAAYHLQVGTVPGVADVFDASVGNVLAKDFPTVEDGVTYYARVRALNGAGSASAWSGTSDGITVDWLSFPCEALDNCDLTFKTGGDTVWQVDGSVAEYGTSSARAGASGSGQTSSLIAVVSGPGSLSFQQALSAPSCPARIELFLDETLFSGFGQFSPESGAIGATEWAAAMISVPPGLHLVRWVYSESGPPGCAAAWVDHVEWVPEATSGGTISGRVTDAATTARIARVDVDFYDSSGRLVDWCNSDSWGDYSSQTLPPGDYWVYVANASGYVNELHAGVSCPGGQCAFADGRTVSVTAGQTTVIDFALERGGRIAGRVRDAASGAAVEFPYVYLYDLHDQSVAGVWADAAGGYVTDVIPTGTYHAFTWNDQGFMDELFDGIPCVGGCPRSQGTPISVAAGATTAGIDFHLERPSQSQIAGRIRDAVSGAPIPQVYVYVYDAAGRYVTGAWNDAAGTYTADVPPGTYRVRTWNVQGYADELFDDMPCWYWICDVSAGQAITVTGGVTTANIDFDLDRLPPATIAGFAPQGGSAGVVVTITGAGFSGTWDVAFNGTAASYSVHSDTEIRAIVPERASSGRISVHAAGGTASSASDFTVVVCDPASVLVPDGRASSLSVPAGGTRWLAFGTIAGRSYSLEAQSRFGGSVPRLNLFRGEDGCLGTSTATVRETSALAPGIDGVRLSTTASGFIPVNRIGFAQLYRASLTNDSAADAELLTSVSETTAYSPAWSTNGSYETYYSLRNTTNGTITAELVLTALDGTDAGELTLSIPSGRTASTNTVALGAPRGRTGSARMTHDGPPGALLVEAAIASFATKPPYVQPLRFDTVRER